MQSPVISIKKNTNTVTASTAGEIDIFADNEGIKTVDESGSIVFLSGGGGGGGITNLSNTPSATQLVVESSNGGDTTLAAATSSLAGVMSAADKTKLDGVQSGAEVNVNADWDALSGDAQILNKPNLGDLALLDQVDTAEIVNHAVSNEKLETMNANTVKGRLSENGTAQDVAMSSLPISTATQTALDGKENIGVASSLVVSHEAASDPHPEYETSVEAQAKVDAHANLTNNPHSVTKSQVGLGNVDNTSDADKPISTATQGALDLKASSNTTGVTGADAITNMMSLTQAEYDAITPNASTFYVIV
jgi:hypothetical protein